MRQSGFSLLEAVLVLVVLAIMATIFVPLASGLVDAHRASTETDELRAIYKGIVGEPKSNVYGYLGDVGDYPASLKDLVAPSPVPAGWNGPYVNDARIQNGILYDQFGGELEYFRPLAPAVPAFPVDQLAIISKGPDRSSDNTGGNASAGFNGTLPSSGYAGYSGVIANADNIVYPKFTDNVGVLNYQSLGRVSYNIMNFDELASVNTFAPGCPGMYDIEVTSASRGTNEAYLTYAPGGAVLDLLQGLYNVNISVTGGAGYPIWQEQLSVQPSMAVNRDLSLPGVQSGTLFGTVSLVVVNNSGVTVRVQQYTAGVGGTINNGVTSGALAVRRCSRISIINNSTNDIIDSFIMPNANFTRRVRVPAVMDLLIVTNDGPNKTVSVYDEGILVGTVPMRGNRRVKVFSLKDGDSITIKNENNGLVETFLLGGSPTTKNY